MKERLHKLIDELNEMQVIYALTFLSRLFGKAGMADG